VIETGSESGNATIGERDYTIVALIVATRNERFGHRVMVPSGLRTGTMDWKIW